MNTINDELLNDYIDNQLDARAVELVNQSIARNEEALGKLKALQYVNSTLKSIEVSPAPDGFTEKVMESIRRNAKKIAPKISYFFLTIVGFFALAIAGVLGTAIFIYREKLASLKEINLLNESLNFLKQALPNFKKLFGNSEILTIVASLTLILLLALYFLIDNHRIFKQKLNNQFTKP